MFLQARTIWLKIAAIVIWEFAVPTLFGIFWQPARTFLALFLDVAIWPVPDGTQRVDGIEANMMLATIAGFSVVIGWVAWTLATVVMPRASALAYRTIGSPWAVGSSWTRSALGLVRLPATSC